MTMNVLPLYLLTAIGRRVCCLFGQKLRFVVGKTKISSSRSISDLIVGSSLLSDNKLVENITIVKDIEKAKHVVSILKKCPESSVFACDTETDGIKIHEQSPVGNGVLICASIYGGPKTDFGDGPGSVLWIDNLDESKGTISVFKDWFENQNVKKIWHNYGFDRHIMHNEGIDCYGFSGDTMHMARLWDSSRERSTGTGSGYSLESLSEDLLKDPCYKKTDMKDLFGIAKLKKDGSEGKLKLLPELSELQRNPVHRQKWIQYSCRDALVTWMVYRHLEEHLKNMVWKSGRNMMEFYLEYTVPFGKLLTDMERCGIMVDKETLKKIEIEAVNDINRATLDFKSWVVKYCSDGKYMNPSSSAQIQAFLFGEYENGKLVSNSRQFSIDKEEDELMQEKQELAKLPPYISMAVEELKQACRGRGLKISGKRSELIERLIASDKYDIPVAFSSHHEAANIADPELRTADKPITTATEIPANKKSYSEFSEDELRNSCIARGLSPKGKVKDLIIRLDADDIIASSSAKLPAPDVLRSGRIKSHRDITITSVMMKPIEFTPAGTPAVGVDILRKIVGNPSDPIAPKFGVVYNHFGGGSEGVEACKSIEKLCSIGTVGSMISNFVQPLMSFSDANSRVHCSLNLNTETGRLSARRPNLQNQPALDKDQYKIRDAFVAAPGNSLIVADYGQLELRVLAHITKCSSMLDAFEKGGCFHSRTAMSMYDHVRKAVENKEVLLEWDTKNGPAPAVLLKSKFAVERKNAKTLNFSIAYGKTVRGLAMDWSVTEKDAREVVNAWYKDRPEVLAWQESTKSFAQQFGFVRTIMGRYRNLPDATKRESGSAKGHAMRAAINTPIQGSAADIVMMAMMKLSKSRFLIENGWKLILQIHDEVILEGPTHLANDAMKEVVSCMENPFDDFGLEKLLVKLDVDAKHSSSWYKAK